MKSFFIFQYQFQVTNHSNQIYFMNSKFASNTKTMTKLVKNKFASISTDTILKTSQINFKASSIMLKPFHNNLAFTSAKHTIYKTNFNKNKYYRHIRKSSSKFGSLYSSTLYRPLHFRYHLILSSCILFHIHIISTRKVETTIVVRCLESFLITHHSLFCCFSIRLPIIEGFEYLFRVFYSDILFVHIL